MKTPPSIPVFTDIQPLADFLAAPERPEDSFTMHELQGYLFTVACSPDVVSISAWLHVVFARTGLVFDESDESVQLAAKFVVVYNQIFDWIKSHMLEDQLPLPVEVRQPVLANLEPDAPLHQWSQGFLAGHESLGELWNETIPDMQEETDRMLVGPLFFSSRTAAETMFRESGHGSFEELAEVLLSVMQQGIPRYARIALDFSDLLMEMEIDPNT